MTRNNFQRDCAETCNDLSHGLLMDFLMFLKHDWACAFKKAMICVVYLENIQRRTKQITHQKHSATTHEK